MRQREEEENPDFSLPLTFQSPTSSWPNPVGNPGPVRGWDMQQQSSGTVNNDGLSPSFPFHPAVPYSLQFLTVQSQIAENFLPF